MENLFEINDDTKLKLVVCQECRTVKATIANMFGDTGWCQTCGKTTKFAILVPDKNKDGLYKQTMSV